MRRLGHEVSEDKVRLTVLVPPDSSTIPLQTILQSVAGLLSTLPLLVFPAHKQTLLMHCGLGFPCLAGSVVVAFELVGDLDVISCLAGSVVVVFELPGDLDAILCLLHFEQEQTDVLAVLQKQRKVPLKKQARLKRFS